VTPGNPTPRCGPVGRGDSILPLPTHPTILLPRRCDPVQLYIQYFLQVSAHAVLAPSRYMSPIQTTVMNSSPHRKGSRWLSYSNFYRWVTGTGLVAKTVCHACYWVYDSYYVRHNTVRRNNLHFQINWKKYNVSCVFLSAGLSTAHFISTMRERESKNIPGF